MVKSKLAKNNPPRLRKEPSLMKVAYSDHFPGCIISMRKLDEVIKSILRKFNNIVVVAIQETLI